MSLEGVEVILVDGTPIAVVDLPQLVSLMYQQHIQVTEIGARNDMSSLNLYLKTVGDTVLSGLCFPLDLCKAKH